MPTANSSHPKFKRKILDRTVSRLLNDIQARMLTGTNDKSGEKAPESEEGED
jgi:hypothetical protein